MLSTGLSLIAAEIILGFVSPSQVIGVGSDRVPNAKYYGWAWPPNDTIQFVNPDSGKVTARDKTNSKGWKDVEHRISKPSGIFRILFLGDSNTFGEVPLKDLYTRQVESMFHSQGYTNIEVISIGNGGWGTDQSLEALKREGVTYQPDLVVYQFCGNDVVDNLSPHELTPPDHMMARKPFRYEVVDNRLVRNERHIKPRPFPLSLRMKKALLKSNVAWNLNQLTRRYKSPGIKSWVSTDRQVYTNEQGVVLATQKESDQLTHWWDKFKPNPDDTCFPYHYGDEPADLQKAWRLLELLIIEMQSTCLKNGSRYMVFSEEGDEGKRQWNLKWNHFQTDGEGDYIMKDGKRRAVNWHRPLENLTGACSRHQIPLIAPKRTYQRYDYDPHPNAEGNLAMAQDIVDYLLQGREVATP